MRILVLSNFYPPHGIGGYELACRDMVEALTVRGHEVRVLTSMYGVAGRRRDGEVFRWLEADVETLTGTLPPSSLTRLRREVANHRAFARISRVFRPDVVYAWNLALTSWSLCLRAGRMRLPVCYFVFDNWLANLERDRWYSLMHRTPQRFHKRVCWRLARATLALAGLVPQAGRLDLRHVVFASRYLKTKALDAGRPVTQAKVIHWGITVDRYPYRHAPRLPTRLLYVGQIVSHKGVHTAVEAMKLVVQQSGHASTTLTLVGGSVVPEYETRVHDLVSSFGLNGHITFVGALPRERLSSVYQDHDILLFPSVWDEPFGMTLLEAMASGLAVVATGTGGSGEILRSDVNALTFPAGDAKGCARQIVRLMEDPHLCETIRENGRHTVEDGFRFEAVVGQLEGCLFEAAAASR